MGGKLIMPSIPSAPTDYVVDQINARLDLLEGSRPSNFYHAKHKERVAPTDYVVDQIKTSLDRLEGSRPFNFYYEEPEGKLLHHVPNKDEDGITEVDSNGILWIDTAKR